MKKKRVKIVSLVISICVGVGLFTFLREERHEIAAPLEVNAELETLVEMNLEEISEINEIKEDAYTVMAFIKNNVEYEIFLQGGILFEYFDGTDWLVIPVGVADFAAGRVIPPMTEVGIGDALYVPRRGDDLFRLRQRVSLTPDQATSGSHDLVVEFNIGS